MTVLKSKSGTFLVTLLLVAGAAGVRFGGAQEKTDPPLEEAMEHSSPPYGGLIDVTAVKTTFVALDKDGRAVLDLRPEELLVLEDGEPARLLDLVRGLGPDEHPPSAQGSPEAGGDATVSWQPWRVVVYLGTELAGRYVISNLCRSAAEEAARLTDLGPVEVVLADPNPEVVARANNNPDEVRSSLEALAKGASGQTTVEQIRTSFMREFKPGVGFDADMGLGEPSPSLSGARIRASVQRERTVVRRELDRMVLWMESQPPATRGLLVWITGGFDLNPADFYLPLMEQVDPTMAQALRTDYPTLSLEEDVRRLVEVAIGFGWTVMPVNSTRPTVVYGAEVDGTAKVQHAAGVGASSIAAQGSEFRQVAPTHPLRIVAAGTGGELVVNDQQFENALNNTKAAYLLTYQVDRPADGQLHRIEIRCARPDIRLRGRGYAASGTLRGIATTRGQRLLAGEEVENTLGVTAEILNITKAEKGQRIGDLRVTADLRDLRAVLRPVDLGRMRVSVVVEIEKSPPFVHHQEMNLDWDQTGDVWYFSAALKWPKKAQRAAVVVEELVSSTWGAGTVELR